MGKPATPTFITEIPLQDTPAQARQLLIRMDTARQVYNACLGESLKRLDLMRQSRIYQSARRMGKSAARTVAFAQARER